MKIFLLNGGGYNDTVRWEWLDMLFSKFQFPGHSIQMDSDGVVSVTTAGNRVIALSVR